MSTTHIDTRETIVVEKDDDDVIDLMEYWRIVRDNKWLIAATAAAITAIAIILTLLATPIFRASSTMQIERDTIQVVDVGQLQPTESPMDRDFYQTQYELLKSRALALRVIQDEQLTNKPEYIKQVEDLKGANGQPATQLEKEKALVTTVLNQVSIEPVRNSRLVKINFDSKNPVLAADVANAWGDAFIASNLERRIEASSYARKFLEERLAQLKARLEDSDKELVAFATSQQIVSVGEDKQSLDAQNLTDLNAALARAQDERIKAQAAWNQAAGGNGLSIPEVVGNSLVQSLREERTKVAAEYADKSRTFKADYPEMRQLSGRIAEIDRQIATEVSNIRNSIRGNYEAARQQESMLQSRIGGLKGNVLNLQTRSIKYNILKREADTNRQLYDSLLQRYKEIGVAGNLGTNNISVVDSAEPPKKAHSPRKALNLAVGLLLGLAAGLLLAFLRHHLDRRVHNPGVLTELINRPVLGIIPKIRSGLSPIEASKDLRSPFSEAYRSVRTALQFATPHGLPKSMLFTSPNAAEGKSTSAMELARNIAQLNQRVLLIDADLRNPSMHKLWNLSNAHGLSSLLAGSNEIANAVHAGVENNLAVMTSGPLPPNPPELLAGERLKDLLAQLGNQFDVIVLDGPPVLGLADAPLLASNVEGTILVATAEQTNRDAFKGAFQRLQTTHANVLGALLTQYDAAKGDNYGYGSYSYYSYGNDAK